LAVALAEGFAALAAGFAVFAGDVTFFVVVAALGATFFAVAIFVFLLLITA
jgi:hypothetical protein